MSRLGREISRGLRDVRKAAPSTFTWEEEEIPCVAVYANEAKVFGEGGSAPDASVTFFVELADFPDPGPSVNDEAIHKGRTYQIKNIDPLPGDDQVKLVCSDPNQAA